MNRQRTPSCFFMKNSALCHGNAVNQCYMDTSTPEARCTWTPQPASLRLVNFKFHRLLRVLMHRVHTVTLFSANLLYYLVKHSAFWIMASPYPSLSVWRKNYPIGEDEFTVSRYDWDEIRWDMNLSSCWLAKCCRYNCNFWFLKTKVSETVMCLLYYKQHNKVIWIVDFWVVSSMLFSFFVTITKIPIHYLQCRVNAMVMGIFIFLIEYPQVMILGLAYLKFAQSFMT